MKKGRALNPSILREYDIRGIVDRTFFATDAYDIGRAFGTLLGEAGGSSVAVGYDGRVSSPEFESALVKGLVSSGATVLRVGLGPSPMLYYATHFLGTNAGIMVTGSHNPPEYNGIKMTMFGKPFCGVDITNLGKKFREKT